MQNKLCSYCGSRKIELYTKLSSAVFKGDYLIEICNSCGIARTNPKPITNIMHYGEAIRDLNISEVADFKDNARKVIVTALQLYTKKYFTAPLRLIDIGCGFGFLVEEARKLDLHAMGIEPSISMAEFASKSGAEIFVGSLFDFDAYEKYEILHLESVLEHMEDVLGLLTFLKVHSSDNSIIIFGQALYDGLLPKVFKNFWYGWSPTEHFCHFSESAFSQLLLSQGFEILKVERTSLIHPFYFGPKFRSLIFQNSKALVSLISTLFKLGDHGYFYVCPIKQ